MGLIADHGIQTDGVDAVEDALFDVGVVPLQPPQQGLHLLPLGAAAAVIADGAVFREAAGALDKLQVVIPPPGDDAVLVDAVQGADELHARKVGAVQLGQHGLELGAEEHAQHRGLDHVVKVVAQSDLVAAQLLCLAVQVPPAHPGAQVAWGTFRCCWPPRKYWSRRW